MIRAAEIVGIEVLEIAGALLLGVILPIQANINSTLIDPLGNIIAPAAVSFSVSVIVLSGFYLYDPRATKSSDESLLNLLKKIRKSLLIIPGIMGPYYVALSTILGREIGFNLFFVCVVTGQLICSTIIDNFGLFQTPLQKASIYRSCCLILVFGGASLAVYERISLDGDGLLLILFMFLAMTSGMGLTILVSMSALVTNQMKTLPHRASWWSFSVGAVLLIVATFVSGCLPGVDVFHFSSFRGVEWWKFSGGILGAIYGAGAVLLGPRLGIGLFFVCIIAGQLLSSLIIDCFGLLGTEIIDATVARIIGVLLVFIAVTLFRFERRIKHHLKTRCTESKQNDEIKTDSEVPNANDLEIS